MPEYKARFLLFNSQTREKQTIVETISGTTVETAKLRAEDLAVMRSKKGLEWKLKALEQI